MATCFPIPNSPRVIPVDTFEVETRGAGKRDGNLYFHSQRVCIVATNLLCLLEYRITVWKHSW